MSILSRLVARALPWRRNPESSADKPEGQHAQPLPLRPEDLRRTINLSEFRSGLRHFVGSAMVALTAGATTAGLLLLGWKTGSSNEAAFFVGFATFTAFNTFWMIAYCRAAGDTLSNLYSNAFCRADEAERQNFVLRKRVMEEVRARHLRGLEGEADGDGGTEFSPSVSRFRRIPLKGEVH